MHISVAVFTDNSKKIEELLTPYDYLLEAPPYILVTVDKLAEEFEHAKKEIFINKSIDILKMTLKEFAEREYEGFDIDEQGNVLAEFNPNAKWDCYTIGGRWKGMLLVKEDLVSSSINAFTITIGDSEPEVQKKAPKGFKWVNSAKVKDIQWKMMSNNFHTYAVLTPDGVWCDKGEQPKSWRKNYTQRFIETADPNWTLIILDCHL